MQAPYILKWSQELSIQAQPLNIPTSFNQRTVLIDEILHASGDQTTDIDWYVKRTVLGGIYSAAEVYMLTDNSPGFQKTVQEDTCLAEAVGAGIGSTVQVTYGVITPEKWDFTTRKSSGMSLSKLVKLLIDDEVRLLNKDRGAVIEALAARTPRWVKSTQSVIRIVGLSTPLPSYLEDTHW
ncbi:hypothetical protein MKW98_018350 [Papaver atlanticum]|uniref:Ubiquinone biosynthesis protein n=1 Tax=Papaver atlanticum TaxID=357466 RepID=A0AAD4XT66_9MAGN|nr:hypothetical protein MKW98_018350 [Papaver atlanticum]